MKAWWGNNIPFVTLDLYTFLSCDDQLKNRWE